MTRATQHDPDYMIATFYSLQSTRKQVTHNLTDFVYEPRRPSLLDKVRDIQNVSSFGGGAGGGGATFIFQVNYSSMLPSLINSTFLNLIGF